MDITFVIKRAVQAMGSQAALARSIGVTQASVSLWSQGKRRPRVDHALAIEAATRGVVRCSDIYPEIFKKTPRC
ncbi:Cro/CI family transcriptional regulator [Acidiferrobacter sp.]|uniref:transcriptional regulator n=1 Tax=Acidiferrobacter sp. TaxID=1872107 RepID=UPI00344B0F1E